MTTITAKLLIEEAQRRGWQAGLLDEDYARFIALTLPDGSRQYMAGTLMDGTSAVGLLVNRNKLATYRIAERLAIPVAEYVMYDEKRMDAVSRFCEYQWANGYELVIKPTNCDHGIGITIGITNQKQLQMAVEHARKFTKNIIVQRRYHGADLRVTVVDGRAVAAAWRLPPGVTGNGTDTIERLIAIENKKRAANLDGRTILRLIRLEDASRFLSPAAFASVPKDGDRVEVSGAANFGRGGTVQDVTDEVHDSYKQAAILMAKTLGLVVCGVDFLCQDMREAMAPGVTILLEINCAIGLRLHHYPTVGQPRNVAAAIIDAVERYSKSKTLLEVTQSSIQNCKE